MTALVALTGARIFDGERLRSGEALLLRRDRIEALLPETAIPAPARRIGFDGGILAPGFVDAQVNGGGGVMVSSTLTVADIRALCAAHARLGTTALLPTLITDTRAATQSTIAAVEAALRAGVPGCAGLHLEGPFIALARKGAHDQRFIRAPDADDLSLLLATTIRPLLVTLAPEVAGLDFIGALAAAGILVSIGHSDAPYALCRDAAAAGARAVTHLFNAQSPFLHRQPGVVGAALDIAALDTFLIADGHHVDPAAIRIALAAKRGRGRIGLVTDAMPTVGTEASSFVLNGRTVRRRAGRLTLDDGTLAGSDLDMASAVRFMVRAVGTDLEEALRMASLHPAETLGLAPDRGRLVEGARADVVHLTDELRVDRVLIAGSEVV